MEVCPFFLSVEGGQLGGLGQLLKAVKLTYTPFTNVVSSLSMRWGARIQGGMGKLPAVEGAKGAGESDGGPGLGGAGMAFVIEFPPYFGRLLLPWQGC